MLNSPREYLSPTPSNDVSDITSEHDYLSSGVSQFAMWSVIVNLWEDVENNNELNEREINYTLSKRTQEEKRRLENMLDEQQNCESPDTKQLKEDMKYFYELLIGRLCRVMAVRRKKEAKEEQLRKEKETKEEQLRKEARFDKLCFLVVLIAITCLILESLR